MFAYNSRAAKEALLSVQLQPLLIATTAERADIFVFCGLLKQHLQTQFLYFSAICFAYEFTHSMFSISIFSNPGRRASNTVILNDELKNSFS